MKHEYTIIIQAMTHQIDRNFETNQFKKLLNITVAQLTNEELFFQSREYGKRAVRWRNRFLGLLGEVYKRKLFLEKGFGSIHEFAGKLAGVSHAQVDEAIRFEKELEKKSKVFHEALVTGEVSMYTLARAASVVTKENEEKLMERARVLSRRGLDQLVRDMKAEKHEELRVRQAEVVPHFIFGEENSFKGGVENRIILREDVQERLLELQNKGLDVNDILMEMMNTREREIAEGKKLLAREVEKKQEERLQDGQKGTRYIPKKITTLLQKEFGTKCAIARCQNRSAVIHHTARFSVIDNHNPLFLAPLCKQHHEIAHAVDGRVTRMKWGER